MKALKEMILQYEKTIELFENKFIKSLDHLQEFKCTLIEKNEQTLDVILSKPGIEDTKHKNIKSGGYNDMMLSIILKYKKMDKFENTEISYEKYKKGNDKYTKIIAYLNKELYDKLEAQHNKK